MTEEKAGYWEQIASRLREELDRKNERIANEVRISHANSNGKLSLPQKIAIANGLHLPTPKAENKHNHHK